MKNKKTINTLRLEYIASLTEVANLASDRDSQIIQGKGMFGLRLPDETEESKQIIKEATRKIVGVCNKLRSIEQLAFGEIGIPAVFDTDDVPTPIRVAMAILVQKSTSGTLLFECRFLNTFMQLAGGDNPEDLLTVREAFRKTGVLRPHVHCYPGRTIDEMSDLTLTENAYRKLLALEPDYECEEMEKARELVFAASKR